MKKRRYRNGFLPISTNKEMDIEDSYYEYAHNDRSAYKMYLIISAIIAIILMLLW